MASRSMLVARRLSVWNRVSNNRCSILRVPFVAACQNQRQTTLTMVVFPTTAVSSVMAGSCSCRQFAVWSSQKPPAQQDDEEQQPDDYKHRHMGIQMHPDSISNLILPGNVVVRKSRQGDIKKRYTELVYGYFWMLKDLKLSQEKPVLSNKTLIEEKKSKIFPNMKRLKSLSGNNIVVDFPSYLLRKNRSRDPNAQCTLVAISFRDFGYQQLPSWIEPFEKDAFINDNERVEIVKLNISEGWFNKWILRGFILGITKRNTPDKTEQERTFMYFNSSGSTEMENLRDSLRMHNVMVGYVFLLDGLGRVRFAGSGMATKEESRRLVQLAKQLTPLASTSASASKRKRRKGGNVNKTAVP